MGDGTEFDEALLGLPGFRVLAVSEDGDELLVGIETIRRAAGCPTCGVIARTKDRLRVIIRDLPAFNRPPAGGCGGISRCDASPDGALRLAGGGNRVVGRRSVAGCDISSRGDRLLSYGS
jgi:hypothetical protein